MQQGTETMILPSTFGAWMEYQTKKCATESGFRDENALKQQLMSDLNSKLVDSKVI